MKISILCSDPGHPVMPRLREWQQLRLADGHDVTLHHEKRDLTDGDLLFLVSCTQLLSEADRKKHRATLVLHASDLPRGRGWSPHVWAVLRGESEITVCLLEAREPVDSGDIWLLMRFALNGSELLPEINELLFSAELELMTEAVARFGTIVPVPQAGPASYLQRRSPEDSRLDPQRSIAQQFDLLRVVDSQRYPAFFDFRGCRYVIRIEKVDVTARE